MSNTENNPKETSMQQHKTHKNNILTVLNPTKNLA